MLLGLVRPNAIGSDYPTRLKEIGSSSRLCCLVRANNVGLCLQDLIALDFTFRYKAFNIFSILFIFFYN